MHGVVSCGSPHTAKAAVEVLKAGGNAVDAAIAATFATSVGEAALTSLGGGGVALVREPNGKRTACNFFSVA
ncbi:MAG: Gamma-glutamyltranspeptidase, partial [Candidatus Eisenbacteria bacterium]|nr:Gamma-glutamyltranspeptidase [Candidatus Eisenbacteria bacterium]